MTTARKLILAGTALVLIAALIGGATFYLGSSNSSTDTAQTSLSASGSASRRDATDANSSAADVADEAPAASGVTAAANESTAPSTGSSDAAGAASSTTGATSGTAGSPAPSGPGSSSSAISSLPPIVPLTPSNPITPITIAPILFDVFAPSVSNAACGIWNFFTVDISDASGVSAATVSYSDGGTIRTATLDRGPGTIWSKILVHNSASPLAWITVHATDTFGNTSHVTVGATC